MGLSLVGGGRLADDIYQGLLPLGELFFGFGNFDYCIPEPEPIEPAVPSDPNAPLEPSDPNAPLEPDSEGDDGTLPEFEDCAAPPSFEDSLEDFQDETGLTLPDDLATLLGDELNVYVGSQGIEDVADADSFDEVLENAQAGIEFTSDGDVVDVLETLLDYSGIDLEVTATDGGAIIGTNDDAVETLEDDHGLGGTEAFGSVAEEHDRPLAGVFVDIAGVVDALKAFGMPAKEADDLAFLKAFAATAWLEDDNVIGFSAKLSFTPED